MPPTIPLEMPSSKAPASILIIDDIPQIHNFLSMHLRSENYTIHRAVTGMEGLEIVAQQHIDLVLLDIGLPDISGFEVLKQLKSDSKYASIPVMILTIRDLTENIVRALEMGAHDYVTKPFEPAELRARVKSAISMKFFQEKLEQSKKQFVTMINSLAEVVFQLTYDGEINFINSTWEEMSGYSVKDSLLVSLFDFLHADDVDTVRTALVDLAAGAVSVAKLEIQLKNRAEEVFWGEVHLRALHTDNGSIMGFAGTLIDVTKRKKVQKELELRTEHFRLVLENSDTVVLVVSETGTIQYASAALSRVLYCSEEKVTGHSLLDFIHPDDAFIARSALADAVSSTGLGEPVELRLACHDGQYQHCELVLNNLLLSAPVGGIVVTLRDITEQKVLQHTAEVQDNVLESLRDIISGLQNSDGTVDAVPVLEHLALAVGADAAGLYMVQENTGKIAPYAEWWHESMAVQEFPDAVLHAWLTAVEETPDGVEGQWYLPDLVDSLSQSGLQSVFLLPLLEHKEVVGMMCFGHCREAKVWTPLEKNTIQTAAYSFSLVLTRSMARFGG